MIFTYLLLIDFIIYLFDINIPKPISRNIEILSWHFIPFLLFVAFLEELVFRMPLLFAIEFGASFKKIIFFAVILSVIFGVLHGGIFYIFVQGFIGFIWCILFLKCGGYQKNYVQAIIVTTTAHFSHNLIVSALVLLSGATKF